MGLSEFSNYLIIVSFIISAVLGPTGWLFFYRELKGMRKDLSDLKIEMTRESALRIGQDHEARIARLERAMINAASLKVID
jgi:hypothetical protein